MVWEIQTLKWTKLGELERRVTELIASSVAQQRQSNSKLNSFISGLEESKENLKLELSATLNEIGVDSNSASMVTVESASVCACQGLVSQRVMSPCVS